MVDYQKLSVSNFHIQFTKYIFEKDHVLYNIELICKDDTNVFISFTERYSTLETLHEKFKKEAKSNNYPSFPPKKYFGNTEPKFLSQRLNSLQSYFTNILSHKEFSKLKSVKEWIVELFKKYYSKPKDSSSNTKSEQQEVKPKENLNNGGNDKVSKKVEQTVVKKNNLQEILNKCSEIVDKYSRQIIDLTEEVHQTNLDPEDEKSKEKKYQQIVSSTVILNNLFELPKGNDNNFQALGEDYVDLTERKKKLKLKLALFNERLSTKIDSELVMEGIVSPILNEN